MNNPYEQPIAVIGLGAAVPGAVSVKQYFYNLLHQRCFIRETPAWLWEREVYLSENASAPNSTYAALAALCEDPHMDLTELKIPPSVARSMSRSQKLALYCARAALEDADWRVKPFNHERVGVMIAAIGGGEIMEALHRTIQEDRVFARLKQLAASTGREGLVAEWHAAYERKYPRFFINEDTLTGASPNLVAGRIASAFDFHGPNLTFDAACASSLAAIGSAVASLQARESDVVLAGGVDTWVAVDAFVQFAKITALARNGCFPFDDRSDGFVLGEGCGVAVLKRLDDALRDGHEIYAVIRGVGSSSDGRGTGITAPSSAGQIRAMRRAYERAGIDPATLDYLECHGTGTRVGDPTELETIQLLLEESAMRRKQPLFIGSVKASLGHLRTAAGIAGFLNAVLVINNRVIPAQVNFEQPTRAFDWTRSNLRVPVRPELLSGKEVCTGISAFGFGGTNYHLVVSSPPHHTRAPILKLSNHLLPDAPVVDGEVAFLFPGQGSQYIGMLAEVRDTEIGRDYLSRADAIVEEITGRKLSRTIFPIDERNAEECLRATDMAQPALLTMSAIVLSLVRSSGIACSLAMGHSLGEYSALYACGVMNFEDAIRAVTTRGRLMTEGITGDPGAMAYLLGTPEKVSALMDRYGQQITRANINSYEQIVVAGASNDVTALMAHAHAAGIRAERLNVDRAFHSSFVSHAATPLREFLSSLVFFKTQIPIPANISKKLYPLVKHKADAGKLLVGEARNQLIDLLTAQIDHTVDFVSQIELAYQAGIRRFVEIGPRQVLTGLVSDILQGKYFQTIALDQPGADIIAAIRNLPETLSRPLSVPRKPLQGLIAPQLLPVNAERPNLESLSMKERIRAVVATVSGYDLSRLGDDRDFTQDLGLDSLKLVEIISRLRGNVLPGNYLGFRNLTSIDKIAATARGADPSIAMQTTSASSSRFKCWRNIEKDVIARTSMASLSAKDWALNAHTGTQTRINGLNAFNNSGPYTLFLRPVTDTADLCENVLPDLLDAVHALLSPIEETGRRRRLAVVTYGGLTGSSESWFRALRGFLLSAKLDILELDFSYHHLDADIPDLQLLKKALADNGLGRRVSPIGNLRERGLIPFEELAPRMDSLEGVLGPDDIVLVTGGARGIASSVVRSLLQHCESRFLLIGRQPTGEPWIESEGCGRVEYLAADVTDLRALQSLKLDKRGVTILIHAAGVGNLTPLRKKSKHELKEVLAVKALGLDQVVSCLDCGRLRGVVSFSSIVAHFGNLAQADYAAANGFLDGYRLPGIPTLSIGWTAWDEIGMASRGMARSVLETAGVEFIPVKEGVALFERILASWLKSPPLPLSVAVFGNLGVSLAAKAAAPERLSVDAGPPPKSFLDFVQSVVEQADKMVVTLNAAGSATPIFAVCGIYGHAYRLLLLAKEAPACIPFHALQPPNMDWSSVGYSTLADMAVFYADAIEKLRPKGPLALLGTSFGGTVAFEIAVLLQRRGRQVSLLAMVDTMPPEEDPWEFDVLGAKLRASKSVTREPVKLQGLTVAETQLAALRTHVPNGTFKGSIQYYLTTGWGYPGLQDRRFLWNAYASAGLALTCVSGVHGGFALEPTRAEIANHLGRTLTHGNTATITIEEYRRQFVCHTLLNGSGPACLTLPDGRTMTIRKEQRTGHLDAMEQYQSRYWMTGWAVDPESSEAARAVAIFHQERLVHVARVDLLRPDIARLLGRAYKKSGFTAVVDFYTNKISAGDEFRIIGIGRNSAYEIESFIWPHSPAATPTRNIFQRLRGRLNAYLKTAFGRLLKPCAGPTTSPPFSRRQPYRFFPR